ncbi:MAG: Arm DNA-binding domain-containing protein [Cellulophaga sp.]
MKTRHSFHVHFWLKKTSIRKDDTIPIYARIKLDGNSADVSTKEFTLEEHWCSDSQRLNPRIKNAKRVNECLDEMKSEIRSAYYELKKEGRPITAQAVKLRCLGKDKPVLTLNDLIKYHRENDLKKLAQGTAKNYSAY